MLLILKTIKQLIFKFYIVDRPYLTVELCINNELIMRSAMQFIDDIEWALHTTKFSLEHEAQIDSYLYTFISR